MSSSPKILISGAGIGGAVFAFWVLRAYPRASITIIERDPSLRLTGASVDIRSSAVDIIKWMGCEKAIRAAGTNEEGMQFVDSKGKGIATLMATGREDIQTFTSEFEIFRGELAKIFLEGTREKVKIVFGEMVEGYEEREDGVEVRFKKSGEVEKFDLLVAADGFNSRLRGKMLGTKPSEQVYDEGVHIAYFTIKRDLLEGCKLAKGFNETGGRCIFIRPDPHPEGRTRAMLMNVTTKGDLETKERLNKALKEGHESYMQLMEEMYGDLGWFTPEILKGMRKSDDFYCSLFGQIRAPKIQSGRVVLLGDAGYATPGFGTSLAIIGGYVLAGELLRNDGDVKKAAKCYEDILLPFVKDSQGGPVGDYAMQMLNPQTSWGIFIRNTIMRVALGLRLDRLAMNVSAKLGFSEKKTPMGDYQWPAQ
jgi:2-polyprenyl-6-methoxyphenol hydroxylase-like FAD-dependent oxidoreductase